MIFRIQTLVVLALLGMLIFPASAQPSTDRGKRSDEIMRKARTLDLLNVILPVLFTKDQIKKLLPVIEKCRGNVNKIEADELEQLKKLESELDKGLRDAYEKNALPPKETIAKAANLFRALQIRRNIAAEENTRALIDVLKKNLTEGQLKVITNAVNPRWFDPSIDPKKLKDEDKMKFYIREILLDPLAYEVLLKLSK